MDVFEKSLTVLEELFKKDCQFALATTIDNEPSVRVVDTYYDNGAFWIVTYASSRKVKEIMQNKNVALCKKLYSFSGKGYNAGHPLKEENKDIREKLIKVFEPWYFEHNNENDENMCYVKIELEHGFFYKDRTGYKIDFLEQKVNEFPFEFDIVLTDD